MASPLWLRLVDTYTDQPPRGAWTLLAQRAYGGDWQTITPTYLVGGAGNVAFPGFGRLSPGASTDPYQVRVTIGAPHTITETASGQEYLEATVTPWTDDAPPLPNPDTVSFYPAPDYPYGAGTPLLSGSVVDGTGAPVARAAVRCVETLNGTVRTEEVRTASNGTFRLPLRWSEGSTQVTATGSGGTATVTIDVPADLTSALQFTLA